MLTYFLAGLVLGVPVGIGIYALMGANGPDDDDPNTEGMGLLTLLDVGDGDA